MVALSTGSLELATPTLLLIEDIARVEATLMMVGRTIVLGYAAFRGMQSLRGLTGVPSIISLT
jgi:hypothetical protein